MLGVLAAGLALAIGLAGLGNVDLDQSYRQPSATSIHEANGDLLDIRQTASITRESLEEIIEMVFVACCCLVFGFRHQPYSSS